MNPCRIHGCHACCLDTEMPLTDEDIERIEALGFRDFYIEKDGFRVLKNIGRRCFFLSEDGRCRIYRDRPEGCRYYPFVLDIDTDKIVRDSDCPYSGEFSAPPEEKIRELVERLMKERWKNVK